MVLLVRVTISVNRVLRETKMNKLNLVSIIVLVTTLIVGSAPVSADGEYRAWVCEATRSNGMSAQFEDMAVVINTLLRTGEHNRCARVSESYVRTNTKNVWADLKKVQLIMHKDHTKTILVAKG